MKKLSFSLEKYLCAIYDLSKTYSKVTPKILQSVLGYNKASTLEGVKTLQAKGYAEYYPHKGIKLTEAGIKYAEEISERKQTVADFLEKFLLVEKENLTDAANSIEYHLNDYLFERFESFLDFLNFCPCAAPKWVEGFKNYLENGEMAHNCTVCIEKYAQTNEPVKCKGCVI